MSILQDATKELRDIEAELGEPTSGVDSLRLAERIRAVRRLLSAVDNEWVGTTEAKRPWASTRKIPSRPGPASACFAVAISPTAGPRCCSTTFSADARRPRVYRRSVVVS